MIKSLKAVPTLQPLPPTAPHQLSIAFDSIRLRGMTLSEQAKVIAHLASLLMQAAGMAIEERDDDER